MQHKPIFSYPGYLFDSPSSNRRLQYKIKLYKLSSLIALVVCLSELLNHHYPSLLCHFEICSYLTNLHELFFLVFFACLSHYRTITINVCLTLKFAPMKQTFTSTHLCSVFVCLSVIELTPSLCVSRISLCL